MQKVLEASFKEAENFKDDYVSTEHMLLALAKSKGDPVQTALASMGADHKAILQALAVVRGSQRVTDQNPEGKFQALAKYAKDLLSRKRPDYALDQGGTGYGVRLIVELAQRFAAE